MHTEAAFVKRLACDVPERIASIQVVFHRRYPLLVGPTHKTSDDLGNGSGIDRY